AFSLFLLAGSFILQYVFGQKPCPLCIFDRVIVLFITIIIAVALLHNPRSYGRFFYAFFGLGLSLLGVLICARHLWLIHLPPEQVPGCSPGFNYLIETLPLKDALFIILKSAGECAGKNGHF